jgi:hypothetical protein
VLRQLDWLLLPTGGKTGGSVTHFGSTFVSPPHVNFARLKHLRWLPDLAKDRDFSKLIKEDHFA